MNRIWWAWFVPPLVGASFGLLMRVVFGVFGQHNEPYTGTSNIAGVMSLAFLFVVPVVMSALAVSVAQRFQNVTMPTALGISALTSVLTLVGAVVTMLEGSICIAMLCPVFMFCGLIGAVAAHYWHRHQQRRRNTQTSVQQMAFLAVLPLVLGVAEARLRATPETRTVTNVIMIHATPDVVWDHIRSVEAIAPQELDYSFSHMIGLPRPIEATLSHDGVGGVRMASFERGLVFREVVTDWQPERTIAFTIDVAEQPPVALDEHVSVGGRYFDVFDGRYTMRNAGNGDIELTLTSTQRLSTTFNFYASLWTDFVMWDLQNAIMKVIKKRCEAGEAYALRM